MAKTLTFEIKLQQSYASFIGGYFCAINDLLADADAAGVEVVKLVGGVTGTKLITSANTVFATVNTVAGWKNLIIEYGVKHETNSRHDKA